MLFSQTYRSFSLTTLSANTPRQKTTYGDAERTLACSTSGGVAGAGGHRGRLQDDGVAAGGESHRHLLVQDPAWTLSHRGERKLYHAEGFS